MFNPKIWQLTRHMFDNKTTKESWTLGVGAGAALLVAGAGALPALVGVSVTAACATSLRGMWDNFKRKNVQTPYRELATEWKNTIEPYSNAGALQKASSYNNFLDTLKGAMEIGGPNISKLSWVNSLHSSIDSAIYKAQHDGQGVETLTHIKEQTREFLASHVDAVAGMTFVDAMDKPVTNDLTGLVESVNFLDDAVRAHALQKTMGTVSDAQDNERLQAGRMAHLKNKFQLVKQTVESGVTIGNRDPSSVQGLLSYIAESVGRIQGQLYPIVPTLLRDTAVPENKTTADNKPRAAMHFNQLREAWSKTFLNREDSSSAANVVEAYKTFHNKLVGFTEEHGASVDTLEMAGLMHERVKEALDRFGAADPMAKKMASLVDAAEAHLVFNASGVAQKEVDKLSNATTLDTYQDIAVEAARTRSAAMAQAFAFQFAPQPEGDRARVERIQQQFAQLHTGMALGPTNSGAPFALFDADSETNIPATVEMGIAQASYQMEQMRRAQASQMHATTLGAETPSM